MPSILRSAYRRRGALGAPLIRCAAAAALAATAFAAPAAELSGEWTPLTINDRKKPTLYRLLQEGGKPVLHARAEASASGLLRKAAFSLDERPIVRWSWRVSRIIAAADNSKTAGDDSPARIVLMFEGDKDKLSAKDRAVFYVSRKLSGQELPYATLMYIWASKAPVDAVIESPRTRRIQMVVAASGSTGVGAWQTLSRDVVADFRNAFKEEPGRLLAYGIMSDTDNTGETVDAWYGEIEFLRRR